MNGLFGLQSMLHKESTAEDFIQVQLEQLENMDIRDNCLATLEGMRLSEETSVSQYKAALNANKNGGNYTFQPPTKAGDTNITKSDGSHVSSNAKPDEVEQLYTNKDKQASEAFDEIMGLDGLLEAADAEDCLVMGNISDSRMKGLITSDVVLEGEAMVRYMLSHNILNLSGPVAKLYNRATLVRYGIRFPQDIHYGEDMLYFLQYLNHIGRVAFRQSELYQVTMREGSLSRGYYPFESEYACFETCLSEMTTFASRLPLSDAEKTAIVWRNRTAQFFLHSVKSVYALSNAYAWSEQMRCLQSIPVAYYRSFGETFRPEGLSSRLVSTLVSNRWFTLLLVFGYCYEQSRLLKMGDHS